VVYSALLVIGVVSLFIAFLPISALFHVRSNPKAFAVRLWRIVAGVAIVVALNYTLVWLEQQPWSREIFG